MYVQFCSLRQKLCALRVHRWAELKHLGYKSDKDNARAWNTITPQQQGTQLYKNGPPGTLDTD